MKGWTGFNLQVVGYNHSFSASTAALICLQTRHIWSLPAAEVSNTGLVPQNVVEVPARMPRRCLVFPVNIIMRLESCFST